MSERSMKTRNVFTCFQSLKFYFKLVLFGIIILSDLIYAQNLEGKSCNLKNNAGVGTCQLRSKCPYYRERVPGRAPAKVCGFKSVNLPYICCPESEDDPQIGTEIVQKVNIPADTSERISLRKCKEYIPAPQTVSYNVGGLFQSETVTKCGDKTVPLIVGGQNAEEGEFPFMVALGWDATNGYDYNCGGSLISENFVLTAAHCGYLRGIPPVIVRLGDLNIKSSHDDANIRSSKVKRIILHESYTYTSHSNDIALVEMEDRIPISAFNKYIRPVCLWTRPTPNFDVNKSIAIGWGEQQTEHRSETLQKVTLNLYGNEVCQKVYKIGFRRLPNGIVDSMLCSGYLDGDKDSCQGDSGAPLLINHNVNKCDWYHVIGITSFGNGCGNRNISGVYTRVASYIDWIESYVWPN